jgi:acetylglutamate synthase|tara:strand:+ start:878 stop:1426 length:549 start_codon:yes stop_codon:yes gene_type:complete
MTQLYVPPQELEIVKYASFAETGQNKLRALINASFADQGKVLAPDYFSKVQPLAIYIAGNYAAGAITKDLEDAVYVCKFFVNLALEGNGLGKGLLQHILADIGIELGNNYGNSVILRTDPKNKKSNALYLKEFFTHFGKSYSVESADGQHKWKVHQIGLKGEDLERKVQLVADLPITMVPIN